MQFPNELFIHFLYFMSTSFPRYRMQTPLTKARMKSIAQCNCFAPFPVYASCSHHLSGPVSSLLFSRVVCNTVNANCTLELSCIWIQWSMSCASYLLYVWNILHYCSVLFLICKSSTDRYTREGFISVTRMQYSNEKCICKMSEAFTSSLIYWNVLWNNTFYFLPPLLNNTLYMSCPSLSVSLHFFFFLLRPTICHNRSCCFYDI